MANENKVQFNLKNVHYAVMTATGDAPAWADPVKVPGAVSLTLDAQGEVAPFYADGIAYYQTVSNNGYTGSLEMARFPDKMLQDVWGFILEGTDKVLIEDSSVEPKAFALLYQIDGDQDNQYYCMYNCSGTKPGVGASTTTEQKTPQTQSISLSAAPLENNRIMARTTAATTEETKKNWFTAVYEPSSTPAA